MNKFIITFLINFVLIVQSASADGNHGKDVEHQVYQVHGVVDEVSNDGIIIQSEMGVIEIKKGVKEVNEHHFKMGDRIVLYYTIDVKKIESATSSPSSPGQQPGKRGLPFKPQSDDRIFYDARNS